jgi:hypothetical protein
MFRRRRPAPRRPVALMVLPSTHGVKIIAPEPLAGYHSKIIGKLGTFYERQRVEAVSQSEKGLVVQ